MRQTALDQASAWGMSNRLVATRGRTHQLTVRPVHALSHDPLLWFVPVL